MSDTGLLPDCQHASGGPASFQTKLTTGICQRGLRPCHDLEATVPVDTPLLINATGHLSTLWDGERRGSPMVSAAGDALSVQHPRPAWSMLEGRGCGLAWALWLSCVHAWPTESCIRAGLCRSLGAGCMAESRGL